MSIVHISDAALATAAHQLGSVEKILRVVEYGATRILQFHENKAFLQQDKQMLRITNFETDHFYYHVKSWYPYGSTIKCNNVMRFYKSL